MTTRSLRWTIVSLLGIAAAGLLVVLFRPQPLEVDTALVQDGPIAETVADQGIARVRQAYVVAAPVTGHLERVALEVGDRVDADRTLVACIRPAAPEFLDARTRAQADAAVQAARAALASATAQRDRLDTEVTRTRDELRRTSDLHREELLPPQALDNAVAAANAAVNALRAAEADIATRRANLKSAELALADPKAAAGQTVRVTSPASGVVTRLLQQSERTVVVGTPLVEIGDTAGLEAAIEFLSQDAVKIRHGQKAAIFNWGGAADIPAEVRRIEPQGFTKVSALGVEEQRTLVILQFTAPESAWQGLAPGYRVWARVSLRETPSAVLVPIGALVRDNGHWATYRVVGNVANLTAIDVGTLTDRVAEVRDGLAVGEVVIVYPSDEIHDGVRVRQRQ